MTNPTTPTETWAAHEVDCPRCEGHGALQIDLDHAPSPFCYQCNGAGKMLKQYGKLYRIEDICGHAMRGSVVCIMDPNHRGRHSSIGFRCDGCNKMRRSQPEASDPEMGDFCFMCVSEQINPREYWP